MTHTHEFLDEQREFLEDLVAFNEPLQHLKKRDKIGYIWDDQPDDFYLLTLTRRDVIAILQRYLNGALTGTDVYEWSDEFVWRTSVIFETGYEKLMFQILHYLSTDFDHGKTLTQKDAQEFIHQLNSAPYEEEE